MSLLDEIKSRISIEDVLSEQEVYLKRGRCRCPLHNGDNPTSFSVSRDGRYFRCYSCGAKGSVVDLVMIMYSLDLKDAIQWLAQKAGLSQNNAIPHKKLCHKRKSKPKAAPELKLRVVEVQQNICTRKLKALRKRFREGKISKIDYEWEIQKLDAILEGIDGVFIGLDALASLFAYEANEMKKDGRR